MTQLPISPEPAEAAGHAAQAARLNDAARALGAWLSGVCNKHVEVVWTQNRSTMLSYRSEVGRIRLRLHHMFAQAQDAELQAIAHYISGRNAQAARTLDAFIATQMPRFRQGVKRDIGRAQGVIYDLAAIFAALNQTYFHNGCQARIMWGTTKHTRRTKRSIQLGCYVPEDNLIRMHPCLDQSLVPLYFVTGVVFHEMLHEVFGIGQNATRRAIHPPEFVAVEQSHPDYARCQAWQRRHLGRLLAWRP